MVNSGKHIVPQFPQRLKVKFACLFKTQFPQRWFLMFRWCLIVPQKLKKVQFSFCFFVFLFLDFYISLPEIPSCFAFSSQEIPKQTYYTCAVQSSLLLLDNTLSSCSPGDTRWSLYPLSPTCLWSLLQICRKLYMTAINFLQTLKSPSFPTGFYVTFHFLRPVVHILSGGFLPGESGGNLYRGSIPVLGIIVNAARQKSQ